jgi:hypothetical protein
MSLLGRVILSLVAVGSASAAAIAAPAGADDPMLRVPVPKVKLIAGDVVEPLPEGVRGPSDDPRNLEGIWASIGQPLSADGKPPAFTPAVQALQQRLRTQEASGAPTVEKSTLCRPSGVVAVSGNQFPTQIIQRPEKIVIIAEQNRSVWPIYMSAEHPRSVKPAHRGHSVGHWEGDTLVIDSIGFKTRETGLSAFAHSQDAHVVTRIRRARIAPSANGNGDRLIVERTIEDPQIYERTYTAINVARWRPDLQMLEFNCEESPDDLASAGLVAE